MAYQQREDEDLALALAIQASLYDTPPVETAYSSFTTKSSIKKEDRALAQAITDSEKRAREDRPTSSPELSSRCAREDMREGQQTILEIEGKPAVTHQLINGYAEHCKKGCDNCRHMMQMVRLIVTEAKEWCRKDFEMMCYAEHFSLGFWSGARQNKFVVQVVAGKIHVSVTDESWRMWFQRVVSESWNLFKDVALHILDNAADMLNAIGGPQGAIAGAALRAIAW